MFWDFWASTSAATEDLPDDGGGGVPLDVAAPESDGGAGDPDGGESDDEERRYRRPWHCGAEGCSCDHGHER